MVLDRHELTYKEATKPKRKTRRTIEHEFLRCKRCTVDVVWSNGQPKHKGELFDGQEAGHKVEPRRCGCVYNSAVQIAYYIKRCKKHGG